MDRNRGVRGGQDKESKNRRSKSRKADTVDQNEAQAKKSKKRINRPGEGPGDPDYDRMSRRSKVQNKNG